MQASLLFAPFLQAAKEHGASHYLQDSGTLTTAPPEFLFSCIEAEYIKMPCYPRTHIPAILHRGGPYPAEIVEQLLLFILLFLLDSKYFLHAFQLGEDKREAYRCTTR